MTMFQKQSLITCRQPFYRHRSLLSLCFFIANLSCAFSLQSAEVTYSDVLVYGATPAGVCAAVAAAREGAKVTLVEPMNLVGGIMSSGLSFSDSNQTDRRVLRGLFEEIHMRIAIDYAKRNVPLSYDVAVKDNKPWVYEPHVAEKVFNDMLREAGVKVLLNQQLIGVAREQIRITTLRTDKAEFTARQFIDASYEGDLMAAAKVSSVIGRESKSQYGESLAGHQFPKPKVAVSPRDSEGKLLPLLSSEDAGADETDGKVMTYSWRLCMTANPSNRIALTKPATYDPARFEIARRLLKSGANPQMVALDFYPIPGGKLDVNNGIGRQVSMGLIGHQWAWPEASSATRAKIWQQHKDYTLEFLWFLQTDPVVPEKTRQQIAKLGFCNDEFGAFDNWPPVLYIREGRRMVGEFVMTQHDVLENITKPDSIGISSFPIDSHDCQRVATSDGGWINEGTIFPVHMNGTKYGQPHQVAYRCLTPKRTECTNLLVPTCLSASHVAFSSIRVEPTWIVLGQSAGVAAAMAAKNNSTVQELSIEKLQSRLRKVSQVIDLLPEHLAKHVN